MVVRPKRITLTLKAASAPIELPWALLKKRNLSQIEQDPTKEDQRAPNPQLVQAIVHAHVWVKSLYDGTYASVEDLARTAGLHPKVIRKRIRLAFLAPDMTRTILHGHQRASTNVGGLAKLASLSWRSQIEGGA
jgi:hypothetical protein